MRASFVELVVPDAKALSKVEPTNLYVTQNGEHANEWHVHQGLHLNSFTLICFNPI